MPMYSCAKCSRSIVGFVCSIGARVMCTECRETFESNAAALDWLAGGDPRYIEPTAFDAADVAWLREKTGLTLSDLYRVGMGILRRHVEAQLDGQLVTVSRTEDVSELITLPFDALPIADAIKASDPHRITKSNVAAGGAVCVGIANEPSVDLSEKKLWPIPREWLTPAGVQVFEEYSVRKQTTIERLVGNCARCQKDHSIAFSPLTVATEDGYTHWGLCVNTGEPVLMKLVEEDESRVL